MTLSVRSVILSENILKQHDKNQGFKGDKNQGTYFSAQSSFPHPQFSATHNSDNSTWSWYYLLSLVSLRKLLWNLWSCVMRVEGALVIKPCAVDYIDSTHTCTLHTCSHITHSSVSTLLFRAAFPQARFIKTPMTTRPTWPLRPT